METNKQSLSGLKKEDFKKVINGKEVDLFVLTNANGMEVAVTNYGGSLVAIMVPDKNGVYANVIQGHDNIEDCILEMARILKVGYVENSTRSLTKLYEINARYCPVTDTTDTKNINQYWAKNVNTYVEDVEKALA